MSDKVIKNPNREKKHQERPTKYIPNWMQMGIDPVVHDVSNDFKIAAMKKKPKLSPVPVAEHIPVQPPLTQVAISSQKDSNQIPNQTRVNVGLNKNWFEDSSSNEEILFDEIPDPPLPESDSFVDDALPEFDVPDLESEDASGLELEDFGNGTEDNEQVQPGEYCLLVRGNLVAKSLFKEEVEEIIEKILFDQAYGLTNVTIEDIVLMKRIPLRVGILAME